MGQGGNTYLGTMLLTGLVALTATVGLSAVGEGWTAALSGQTHAEASEASDATPSMTSNSSAFGTSAIGPPPIGAPAPDTQVVQHADSETDTLATDAAGDGEETESGGGWLGKLFALSPLGALVAATQAWPTISGALAVVGGIVGSFVKGVAIGLWDGTIGVVQGLYFLATNPKQALELIKNPRLILEAGWEEIKSCGQSVEGAGRCVGLVLAAVLVPSTSLALVARFPALAKLPLVAAIGRHADALALVPGKQAMPRAIAHATTALVRSKASTMATLARAGGRGIAHPVTAARTAAHGAGVAAHVAAHPIAAAHVVASGFHLRTPRQVWRDFHRTATTKAHWSVSGNPRLRPAHDALRIRFEGDVHTVSRIVDKADPNSAIGSLTAQQIDEFVKQYPPGSRYHGAFHDAEVSNHIYELSIARGLSPDEARFNSQVALAHDLNAKRIDGSSPKVSSTLESGEYFRYVDVDDAKKFLDDPERVAYLMNYRTDYNHKLGDFHHNIQQQAFYEAKLRELTPRDQKFVIENGRALSDLSDQMSAYAMNPIDEVLRRYDGLSSELGFHVHETSADFMRAKLGDTYIADRDIAKRLGIEADLPNTEDLLRLTPEWDRNYRAMIASMDDYTSAYKEVMKATDGNKAVAAAAGEAAARAKYKKLMGDVPDSDAPLKVTRHADHETAHAAEEFGEELGLEARDKMGELVRHRRNRSHGEHGE